MIAQQSEMANANNTAFLFFIRLYNLLNLHGILCITYDNNNKITSGKKYRNYTQSILNEIINKNKKKTQLLSNICRIYYEIKLKKERKKKVYIYIYISIVVDK